ncbi:MAG: hypothetical protein BWY83_03292 [bacterium ADurb.Bin478]|nr:MAG: hypothetical protein BWY83_03292 [bacterium ADurb.Bin478]
MAVAGEHLAAMIESHADVHRRLARSVQMGHLMTAVAHPHRAVAGGSNDLAGSFIVQHIERMLRRKRRLMHEHASQLRLAPAEKIFDEILLHRDILIIKFGEGFLIQIVADAHQAEFKKTCHGRRQSVGHSPVLFAIQQQSPIRQLIENVTGLRFRHLPGPGCIRRRKRYDGKQGHQSRLLFAEQHF